MAIHARGREVPITPDGTVTWERVETDAGTLLLPPTDYPESDQHIVELLRMAQKAIL